MANPNIVNVTSIYGNTSYLTVPTAVVTASITTTVLTATAITSGTLYPNQLITGTGVTTNTYITTQLTATNSATVTATFTQATTGSNTLVLSVYTVGTVASIVVGQFVQPITGIPAGTYVTAVNPTTNTITISNVTTAAVAGAASLYTPGQAGTYTVSSTQTVTSTTITTNGTIWTGLTPASGTTNKVGSITATNVTGTAATVTVSVNSATLGAGTAYRLAYQTSVPANSSLLVVDKSVGIYVGETQSIVVSAGTTAAIEMVASYEAIT